MTALSISLTDSQARFVDLVQSKDCDNPLFVGGPGCGKSYLLGLIAVMLVQHSKDANIYVYAPEHHHIRTIEVPNIIYWLDQFKIKHSGHLKHEGMIRIDTPNCGDIFFKPMDNPAGFVGYQSYAALIDELDTLPEAKAEEVYRGIVMRNRQQPDDVPDDYRRLEIETNKMVSMNKVISFTTPEGYNFCYKRWELNPSDDYKQVKGRTADNPTVTRKYLDDLKSQFPAHVAEKYLNGEFVNMQSLSVYFNYDPNLHDTFETLQPGENIYVGCDFNVENTAATIYVKRNGGKQWHAVDELHGIRDAATLADLLAKYAKRGHQVTMYPDSSGSNRGNANASAPSAIQELRNKGFTIRAPSKNGLVDDRVNATNNAFAEGKLFVNQRTCPVTSRCLINQSYDKNGKPDKKSGYDHQNDATTYPIVYEFGLRKTLFRIPFSFAQKRDS